MIWKDIDKMVSKMNGEEGSLRCQLLTSTTHPIDGSLEQILPDSWW